MFATAHTMLIHEGRMERLGKDLWVDSSGAAAD